MTEHLGPGCFSFHCDPQPGYAGLWMAGMALPPSHASCCLLAVSETLFPAQVGPVCHLLGGSASPGHSPAMPPDNAGNVRLECGGLHLHFTHSALLHTFPSLRHHKGRERSISCQHGWMAPREEDAFEAICSASLTSAKMLLRPGRFVFLFSASERGTRGLGVLEFKED